MFESTVYRRLIAVVLLVAGLLVLPAAPALAVGDDEAQASEGENQSVIEQVIEWVVELVSNDEETGDVRGHIDPIG